MKFIELASKISYQKVVKRFEIELPDKSIINYWKSYENDNDFNQFDNDWGFERPSDEKTYNLLTEDEQEDFDDFVEELTI